MVDFAEEFGVVGAIVGEGGVVRADVEVGVHAYMRVLVRAYFAGG